MGHHVLLICSIIFFLLNSILADIYLHNPRGTNNRHSENTRDRTNPKLNFDSQNNDRGGYNVGDDGAIFYYAQSILPIQWTNQHSCNDVNSDCTLILQYTCDDSLRDGQGTTIIPKTVNGENDPQYRLTENLASYLHCSVRSRNTNLFIANQNLKGNSGIYTRQNPNGDRYGFECPEERDYYPHWQPNQWIDIAILTNRQDLCAYYRENSQNVQSRSACTFTDKNVLINASNLGIILPNNQAACETFNDARLNGAKPIWKIFPSNGQPPPECYTPAYTRENHLGDTYGSQMATYNWTLPKIPAKKCVLRIRYNISTSDYDGWNTNGSSNGNLLIMKEYFPNNSITINRGYRFQNNPNIQLFDGIDMPLQLAINTAQYSRVFEDRSFTFEIRQRKSEFGSRNIYNLNVRGRRGNIVQVYPAVEYDFVPNRLEISPNSYVHIQWIGSNTSPDGAGQGKASSDRNNLLMLKHKIINPDWKPFEYLNSTGLLNQNYPDNLVQTNFLNLPLTDLRLLAASGPYSDALLNNAKAYFNLDPRLVNVDSVGVYHYVSTRNNDFSNRDQKGQIIVQPYQFQYQLIGSNLVIVQIDDATITFPEGCVNSAVSIKYGKFTLDQLPEILPNNGKEIASNEKLRGYVYIIEPNDQIFIKNIQIEFPINELNENEDNIDVFRFEPKRGVYLKLPNNIDTKNKKFQFQSDIAGIYVFAERKSSPVWIAGVVIAVVVILLIVISSVIYFRFSPNRYTRVKNQVSRAKRSMFSRI